MPTPNFAQMRDDIDGVVDDWKVTCSIRRQAAGFDAAGRNSGSFASVATQDLWIQPLSMKDLTRQFQGVVEGTTHIATQKHGGYQILKEDRILASGDTYQYDVLATHAWQTHNVLFLKLVKRS